MIKIRQNKGFALAFSLIFLVLIIGFVGVYIFAIVNGYALANRNANAKKAYYVADAGLADAFLQLRGYANAPSSFNVNNSNYTLGTGTGNYSVSVAGNGATWPTYTITSTGTYNGITKSLQLIVHQTSVSSFAYLSNTETHPVWGALWWITGMTTVGPVRTNGQLNIWGAPVFDGTVNETSSSINCWSCNPNFVDGILNSQPTVPFPTTTMLNNISSAASSGGMVLSGTSSVVFSVNNSSGTPKTQINITNGSSYSIGGVALSGNSTIVFNADNTVNITNVAKGYNNQQLPLSSPFNGAIYVQNSSANATDGNVTVQGTIKGQMTVTGANQVYISGNLTYNTDPRTNPSSTDLLGLVSKNDITVLAASAPAQLELDAVLVALNGSFQVDQWWVAGKGNMIQYGSLVNNYCGPTGVFDPGSGILYGGYNQLQYYDPRLQTMIPPAFPPAVDSTGRTLYVKISFQEL